MGRLSSRQQQAARTRTCAAIPGPTCAFAERDLLNLSSRLFCSWAIDVRQYHLSPLLHTAQQCLRDRKMHNPQHPHAHGTR